MRVSRAKTTRTTSDDRSSNKVVALPVKGDGAPPDVTDGTEWSLAKALMHAQDAGAYASWIKGLERHARSGHVLTLRAPSRFHAAYVQSHLERRLLRLCQDVDSSVTELRIIV